MMKAWGTDSSHDEYITLVMTQVSGGIKLESRNFPSGTLIRGGIGSGIL